MRDIAHGFFETSPAMAGPLVALVIFFVVFAAVTVRVLRTRATDYAGDAALPLADEMPRHPSTTPHDGEQR